MKDNRLKSFSGAGLVLLSLMIFFTLLPLEAHAEEPEKVVIGVHVNDIQEIDLRTHSYRLDFYLWFRWNNPEINPAESIEFMNSFEPEDHVRTLIYDEPQLREQIPPYELAKVQAQLGGAWPKLLRIGRLRNGMWEHVFTGGTEFPDPDGGFVSLDVEVERAQLVVSVNGQRHRPIPIPREPDGRVGLMKFYDAEVRFRGFTARR